LTKTLRKLKISESDGKVLIILRGKDTSHKIHHKGGPTQARGKAEILTAWASLSLRAMRGDGMKNDSTPKNPRLQIAKGNHERN